jgi:DNA-binding FrmR family transcriptional regulator
MSTKIENNVSKEQMVTAITQQLNDLRECAEKFKNVVELIQKCSSSDVSFVTIDNCKTVINQLNCSKQALSDIQKIMKARARTRLNEI